jgi:dGTPase
MTKGSVNNSRTFLDGIPKYRRLFRQNPDAAKQFLCDEQEYLRTFVLGETDLSLICDVEPLRTVECEIVDWADDSAYCLNDLVESTNAGFLRSESVKRWAEDQNLLSDRALIKPSNLPTAMGKKVQADYDNFLLRL